MKTQMKELDEQFSRSRNVKRNMVFGLLNRFLALLLPFIVRTVLIYRFGAIYLGINSLFTSILQVLNLAELGFGTAVVYSLYRPFAQNDIDTVCAYLGTYRKIYRVIGCVIFVAGLVVVPFLPRLLQDNVIPDKMNVFVWFLIFLVDASLSYLLYGYKTCIPTALQRNDLMSRIDTVTLVGKSIVQIVFLLYSDNFYLFLLTSLFFTVVRNLLISWMTDKLYPQYVCRGGIGREQLVHMKRLVCGLMLSQVRGVSRHAIDSICITIFIGLTMTAIYSNYFLILNAVISVFGILTNAMSASVGNSIATESTEKTYRDMRRFNLLYMLFAGYATICLLCLYQPFVRLWMGPGLMLGWPEVVALCLYFYLLKAGDMRWLYHQGAGLWWKARYFVVAEIVCNVVLNILLAKYFGVLGIIVATLISLFFINFIGGAWILFQEYFKNGKLMVFFADQARYFLVTVLLAVLCMFVCDLVNTELSATMVSTDITMMTAFGVFVLFIRLLICTFISVGGYLLAYHRTVQFQEAKAWVKVRIR